MASLITDLRYANGMPGKRSVKFRARPGVGMGGRLNRAGFSPGQQFMGGNKALPDFQMLFAVVGHPLRQLVSVG